jgi:hypothetical protein
MVSQPLSRASVQRQLDHDHGRSVRKKYRAGIRMAADQAPQASRADVWRSPHMVDQIAGGDDLCPALRHQTGLSALQTGASPRCSNGAQDVARRSNGRRLDEEE